jgi:hypothetical protein
VVFVVQFRALLNSALDESKLLASSPGSFNPRETTIQEPIGWKAVWASETVCSCGKETHFCFCRELGPTIVHYIRQANPVHSESYNTYECRL